MKNSKTNEIIRGYAKSWAELQAKVDYLNSLIGIVALTSQQESYVLGYIKIFENQLENIEDCTMDYGDNYYTQMRDMADSLMNIGVKVSPEFTQEVESKIKDLNMSDFDFHINRAVQEFNLACYPCSIIIGSSGYVSFVYGVREDDTVLITSNINKFINDKDVKDAIEKLDLSF